VPLAERGGEAGAGLVDAVGETPDGEARGAGRDSNPGAYLLGVLQQRPRLVVELGSGRGERDPGRRARAPAKLI